MAWRPDEWVNPFHDDLLLARRLRADAYEEGADAAMKALWKELEKTKGVGNMGTTETWMIFGEQYWHRLGKQIMGEDE